jgi:hypothetical protein
MNGWQDGGKKCAHVLYAADLLEGFAKRYITTMRLSEIEAGRAA